MVIGIDPSLTKTGIAVIFDDPKNPLLFLISVGDEGSYFIRARRMATLVLQKIKEVGGGVSKKDISIFIEGQSFGSIRSSSLTVLAEIQGIIKYILYENGYREIYTISPKTCRKVITGSGKSSKEVVPMKIFKRFGLEIEEMDVADAFAVAFSGHSFLKGEKICVSKVI